MGRLRLKKQKYNYDDTIIVITIFRKDEKKKIENDEPKRIKSHKSFLICFSVLKKYV